MTQFIPVTIAVSGTTEWINVALICRYHTSVADSVAPLPGSTPPTPSTTIYLVGGAELYVSESLAAVGTLISDVNKTAVVSVG